MNKSEHCLDDRFIAKELSKAELETMAIFGPAYFEHMSTAIAADVSFTCSQNNI